MTPEQTDIIQNILIAVLIVFEIINEIRYRLDRKINQLEAELKEREGEYGMSQWTHVNGSIRFDALRIEGMPFNTVAKIKELLGNTALFEDSKEVWDKCNVPFGSEESIQFNIWDNPNKSSMAAFVVSMFGDLRNFGMEDVPKIKEWFKRVTETEHVMIRSAILEIDVEYSDEPIILRFEKKEGE